MLGEVRGDTGAPSSMRTSPLPLKVFFASILLVAIERFSKHADKLEDCSHLQERPLKFGSETPLECVRRPIWEMLYADDACIVLQSPRGLERMMTAFVEVSGTFI